MFVLRYKKDYMDTPQVECFNDIKSIREALINIVNDEEEEMRALKWCEKANWGNRYSSKKYRYSLKCFSEVDVVRDIEGTLAEILNKLNIRYRFVGVGKDGGFTWMMDLVNCSAAYISYTVWKGYYLRISKYDSGVGSIEIASSNKKEFKVKAKEAINKHIRSLA